MRALRCPGHRAAAGTIAVATGRRTMKRKQEGTRPVPDTPNYATDTCDDLLDLSRANGQALVLGTIAFLHEIGVDPGDWAAYLGNLFAASWDPDLDLDAETFLDAMLTNFRSLGAEVIEANLALQQSRATIAGFPKPELCSELSVDGSHADIYLDVPYALAREHGLTWDWRREGLRVVLTAECDEGAGA
jgi:hypothetical protein